MGTRVSPLLAAGLAVGAALVVTAVWWGRANVPAVPQSAVDAIVAVRITRHDELGMPSKPIPVRERARVRAIVEALGVDAQPTATCPPDYASAEIGLLLVGADVYARRNVYVWNLFGDAGAPSILVVSSGGCRGGAPADAGVLRGELTAATRGDASR